MHLDFISALFWSLAVLVFPVSIIIGWRDRSARGDFGLILRYCACPCGFLVWLRCARVLYLTDVTWLHIIFWGVLAAIPVAFAWFVYSAAREPQLNNFLVAVMLLILVGLGGFMPLTLGVFLFAGYKIQALNLVTMALVSFCMYYIGVRFQNLSAELKRRQSAEALRPWKPEDAQADFRELQEREAAKNAGAAPASRETKN